MKPETIERLAQKGSNIYFVDPAIPEYFFAGRVVDVKKEHETWYADLQPYVGFHLRNAARTGDGLFGIPLLGREDKYYGIIIGGRGLGSTLITSGFRTRKRQAHKQIRQTGRKMLPQERSALMRQFEKYLQACKELEASL